LIFWENLARHGSAPALTTPDGQTLAYAQLDEWAAEIGGHLSSRGGFLLILCENNFPSVAGYLAALRAHTPVLLLNSSISPGLLRHIEQIYPPSFTWKPAPISSGQKIYSGHGYTLARPSATATNAVHPELALLLSTSGTTGSPKLVRISRDNLAANTKAIVSYLGITETDRPITTLPMSYTYGLSILNTHLAAGAHILLTNDSVISKEFWRFYKTYQGNSLAGVPYTYQLISRLGLHRLPIEQTRTMTQAGGRLSADLGRQIATFCHQNEIRFFIMYGQTEATARISYVPPEHALAKHTSIGISIPGGTMRLSGPKGEWITTPGTEGELVYKGPNVSMGYAERATDLARGDDFKGILRTGDLAYFDDDGFFHITGRKKRFIKISGNRVNLDDIEAFLLSSGIECACFGEDDRLRVAVTTPEAQKDAAESIKEQYGIHHSFISLSVIDAIPRTSAGKTDYNRLIQAENSDAAERQ